MKASPYRYFRQENLTKQLMDASSFHQVFWLTTLGDWVQPRKSDSQSINPENQTAYLQECKPFSRWNNLNVLQKAL